VVSQNAGMGLRIMNYRANLIGASVEIKPGRPDGTQVTCSLPLQRR
jgi:signal transduction histidine kinase